ncbi:Alg9-like mannosyltransferase family-domain-containing protein [Melanogaster broomeanus]|nr:Alg9-like mannosyltransferase family-domain-containing protein [Melanogaster broomeanus]
MIDASWLSPGVRAICFAILTATKYDHNMFPGAIPRTFGLITSKPDLQLVLRLVLASLNAIALIFVRRAVSTRFGRQTSWWYCTVDMLAISSSFTWIRSLNLGDVCKVNFAYYALYNRAPKSVQAPSKNITIAVALLTFTAVVFRSELAVLLALLALQLLIEGHSTFLNLVTVGLLAGLTSIAITVAVDSYFWAQWPLWPELYAVYFNVYLGKSADWGTSPAHTYFTAYLPKLLLSSSFLSVVGATLDHRIRSLLCAPILFVFALSALGHKEWRFIIYVVPLVNIAAARGARWMTSRKKGFVFKYLTLLCALSLIALNFIVTLISTRASMANYPGGVALDCIQRAMRRGKQHPRASIQSRSPNRRLIIPPRTRTPFMYPFLASEPSSAYGSWTYNKTESLTPSMIASSSFTHLIT